MKPNNPFVTIGYFGPEYFCDRRAETKKLVSAVENDSNVTLIAPRRYGKTGLIQNAFHYLRKDHVVIYLDIYSTCSLAEFTRLFAAAVTSAGDTTIEKTSKAVARFFRSCRTTITPQEDGMPKFSFDVVPDTAEPTLRETFEYLKSREKRIVIAIDEFQQILEYPERGTEALLRSLIQEVPWIRFIFAGSRHHLMGEMFLTAKHPFYNSTDVLSLKTIDRTEYAKFAGGFLKNAGKPFCTEAFEYLYDKFDGITWYIQRVMKSIWNNGEGLTENSQVDAVTAELVTDRESTFFDLYESQNEVAKKLLSAIASRQKVSEPTSAEFLSGYSLCASSVRSAIADLTARDVLYRTSEGITVYERLFGEWLRREASDKRG